jgi:hypothetical protein
MSRSDACGASRYDAETTWYPRERKEGSTHGYGTT